MRPPLLPRRYTAACRTASVRAKGDGVTGIVATFLNVLVPVFALLAVGYFVAPRLGLQSRTLSRFAYYIVAPAFVFSVLGTVKIEAALALRMAAYFVVLEVIWAAIAFALARALRRDAAMTAAYVLIAVFPNVGNFGIPITQFALGGASLPAATVYFVASTAVSFVIGVAAANAGRGGEMDGTPRKSGREIVFAVAKTPALVALIPALVFSGFGIPVPPPLERPASLLAGALVPTMLVALGAQLAAAGIPRLSLDMLVASAARLVVGPLVGVMLVAPFGLVGVERATGILQSAMPSAVLASIIALENDLLPQFVIATVLFSTLVSLMTLTVVLLFVR